MSRYVLRLTEIYKYEGWCPVGSDRPLYLYKSVSKHRDHGYPIYKVTDCTDDARSWATRAGVEGYLAAKFNGRGYVIEEVTL